MTDTTKPPSGVSQPQVALPDGIFDERKLRAEIVKTWGGYGAHVEVFDDLLSRLNAKEAEASALREALRELVACKDLKEQAEAMRRADNYSVAEVRAVEEDYNRRKPLAWKAARDLLAKDSA